MEIRRIKNDELSHAGIKGQKWGVRRYQNTDGSLTSAGIQRYRKTREDYDHNYRDMQNKARATYYSKQAVSVSQRSKNPLPDSWRGDIARRDGYREAMKDKAHYEMEARNQRLYEQGVAADERKNFMKRM